MKLDNYANLKTLFLENGVLIIGFDNDHKKVNILSTEVIDGFSQIILPALKENQNVKGIVITSLKEGCFIAGADIEEIAAINSKDDIAKFIDRVHLLFNELAESEKPIVAAIEGVCMGGGLELALACHWRVATKHPKTIFSLPEVKLGIIPGFGGTQRLPKLIGLRSALEMAVSGKSVFPSKAVRIGLIDDLVDTVRNDDQNINSIVNEPFVELAINRVEELSQKKIKRNHKIGIVDRIISKPLAKRLVQLKTNRDIFKATGGHYQAPRYAADAVINGLNKSVLDGSRNIELPAISELVVSPSCKNLISIYFGTEEIKKTNAGNQSINRESNIVVIGAGLMGSQIATDLVDNKFGVDLKDVSPQALKRGLDRIISLEQALLNKRVIKQNEYESRLLRLNPATWHSPKNKEFVIEAVAEILELKQRIVEEFEETASQNIIFATNTSSFTVSEIAQKAKYKERFIAMHFFNPVRQMKLVEIGVADFTSQDTIAKSINLAKSLGKYPLLVRECPGLLVNRILARYLIEAVILVAEGVKIERIDGVAKNFGMAIDSGHAMGPLELIDYVGIMTCAHVIKSLHKLGPRIEEPTLISKMANPEKPLSFWRNQKPNTRVGNFVGKSKDLSEEEIRDRLVLPMVDEARRCLAENIIDSPRKLDMAMLYGAGFPAYTGGLMKWASDQDVNKITSRLEELTGLYGPRFEPFSK